MSLFTKPVHLNGIAWTFHPCPHCAGTGRITRTRQWHNDIQKVRFECMECTGRGYLKTVQESIIPTRNCHYHKRLAPEQ